MGAPLKPVVVCQSVVHGGAERYLVNLYRGFAAHGHEPLLIGDVPGWEGAGLRRVPVPLGPKWSGRATLKRLPGLPRERAAVADRLDRLEVTDAIHVQFKREQIGFTGALSRRAPVLWTEHGRFATGIEGRLLARGYARAAKRASTIVCVSDAVADDVRNIVGPDVRLLVVPNAIDTSTTRPPTDAERAAARAALALPADRPVLAWVGRMHPGKLPMLAAQAGMRFPGVTVMAGGGDTAEVKQVADGERVKIIGHLDDPSLIYRAADLLIFTSMGDEGYPTNTMLEASAHGVPIIANSQSRAQAVVEAAGGVVVDDDPQVIAAVAKSLLTERADRSRLARSWALEHDLQTWVELHEEIISGLSQYWPRCAP